MKIQGLVLLAAVALMSGCAAPPKYDWVKADATPQTKASNISECQYQVKLNKTPAAEQAELVRLCMQGKGYRYARVN